MRGGLPLPAIRGALADVARPRHAGYQRRGARSRGRVRMKFLHIAITLVTLALAGCGSLSLTGTPEIETSLNGFRAAHGLSQLRTDGTLIALASEHSADMARRDSLDHDGFM